MICNDFYIENTLRMIFTKKNELEMIFTMKIRWK